MSRTADLNEREESFESLEGVGKIPEIPETLKGKLTTNNWKSTGKGVAKHLVAAFGTQAAIMPAVVLVLEKTIGADLTDAERTTISLGLQGFVAGCLILVEKWLFSEE